MRNYILVLCVNQLTAMFYGLLDAWKAQVDAMALSSHSCHTVVPITASNASLRTAVCPSVACYRYLPLLQLLPEHISGTMKKSSVTASLTRVARCGLLSFRELSQIVMKGTLWSLAVPLLFFCFRGSPLIIN